MNRLERISAILVRLQSRPVVTARQIAGLFGVSLRTVYRDIRVLEESGIPITGNAGLGYSLADGFKLPPLMFTTEEAIAFLMAEKVLSHHAVGDSYELYRNGMDKIRAVLRSSGKNILEDFDHYIQVMKPNTYPIYEPEYILQPLLHCIIGKQDARIEYFANYNRELSVRDIEPLGLYFMADNWYLLAWCRLRKDYRTFNLARIKKLIPGNHGFTKEHPGMNTLLDRLYPDEITYHIRLKVEKSALRNVGAGKYVYGLYKEEDTGDYIIQHYMHHSLEHFGRWYLSFADKSTILEPAELKTTIKKLIKNIKP